MFWIILSLLIAVALVRLAVVIWRYTQELNAMRLVANNLSIPERDQIFELIEGIGVGPSRGFLGLLNVVHAPTGQLAVAMPKQLADFPWAGSIVEAKANPRGSNPPVSFGVFNTPQTDLGKGVDLRWLAIPQIHVGQKKQLQNVFSIDRYLQLSPSLAERLRGLYPADPKFLLSQLLSTDGRHHSREPFDQLRCGLPAAWIQTPIFHKCPDCRRPMRLILQVPGALIASRLGEGCFYLFGCPSHPTQTAAEEDWG